MALRFACPRCGMQLSAPEDCAGRSSKCRACGQTFQVPAPVALLITAPSSPPIRCRCPRCQQSLEAPAAQAGQKTNCPTCGQRIQLPALPAGPPLNKTVLAPLVEEQQQPPLALIVPPSMVQDMAVPTAPREPVSSPDARGSSGPERLLPRVLSRARLLWPSGLALAIALGLVLLGIILDRSANAPNARCPYCATQFHIGRTTGYVACPGCDTPGSVSGFKRVWREGK
jgi:hypothetical protein